MKNFNMLKKDTNNIILLTLLAFAFVSCGNDDDSPPLPNVTITNVQNIADGEGGALLDRAFGITTDITGEHLFVAANFDNAINSFGIAANGNLTFTQNQTTDPDILLNVPTRIVVVAVNGNEYVCVTAFSHDAVQVFGLNDDGTLTNVTPTVTDTDDLDYNLNGADGIASITLNDVAYIFVAGRNDDGISVFSIDDAGALTNEFNVSDSEDLVLNGVNFLKTATIEGIPYLFATSLFDNAIQVFRINETDGSLESVDSVTDDDNLSLDEVRTLDVVTIGNNTYLYTGGENDSNGISIFKVNNDGTLTYRSNIKETLDNILVTKVSGMKTKNFNGFNYLWVSHLEDTETIYYLSTFVIHANGNLTPINTIENDGILYLNKNYGIEVIEKAESLFIYTAGFGDDGISVFQLQEE